MQRSATPGLCQLNSNRQGFPTPAASTRWTFLRLSCSSMFSAIVENFVALFYGVDNAYLSACSIVFSSSPLGCPLSISFSRCSPAVSSQCVHFFVSFPSCSSPQKALINFSLKCSTADSKMGALCFAGQKMTRQPHQHRRGQPVLREKKVGPGESWKLIRSEKYF